jgi:putative transposase
MAMLPGSSHRRVCRVLNVPRASAEPRKVAPTSRREWPVNALLAERIRGLIQRFPPFGYRRLWAWLYFREGFAINKKAVLSHPGA